MSDIPCRDEITAELDTVDADICFAVVSGAHLYGFPSRDSDVDVRGAYVARVEDVVGLGDRPETIDRATLRDGTEVDLSLHEVEKFIELLLGRNAVALEQVFSPLIVHSGDAHDELKAIAADCITRHHAHHYLGFARSRREAFGESGDLKALLYAYRALLSGLHLMESGRIEANLDRLASLHDLPELLDLTRRKREGAEQMPAPETELADPDTFAAWAARLEEAYEESDLPEATPREVRRRASDLLVHLRLDDDVAIERTYSGAPWEEAVGYCRAIRAGERIHVTGTAPIDDDGTTHAPGDAYAQTHRCLELIERALTDLGTDRRAIVRTRLFVTDIDRWSEYGRAHAEFFGDQRPATTMVEVARLIDGDMLIEIEADALAPQSQGPQPAS